jgi:hypothetical protein
MRDEFRKLNNSSFFVMAGLVPAIHVLILARKVVDARDIWRGDALRAFARA